MLKNRSKIKERRLRTKDQFDFPRPIQQRFWNPRTGHLFSWSLSKWSLSNNFRFLKWRWELTIPWQITDLLSITKAQYSRTFMSCPERIHVRVLPRCYESSCQWVNWLKSWLIIDFKPWLYNFEPVKSRIART